MGSALERQGLERNRKWQKSAKSGKIKVSNYDKKDKRKTHATY